MNKKSYEKPEMKVVELQHQQQLLTGSSMTISKDDWNNDWENE